MVPDTEMVAVTAWLPLAVGQVAALAGVSAPSVMIMTLVRPTAASAAPSARRRMRAGAGEAMSLCLLPVGGGQACPVIPLLVRLVRLVGVVRFFRCPPRVQPRRRRTRRARR